MDSADYFCFPTSKSELSEYLDRIASSFDSPQRLRLLLDRFGTLYFETAHFQPATYSPLLNVCLARQPIDSNHVFLFHKSTYREMYESARRGLPEFDDTLLHNERGELTEFTIGNLVVELNKKLLTPPISCGLLAGTFRAHLMETGQVTERTIRIEELKDCTKIFLINSVRKWQEVELIS